MIPLLLTIAALANVPLGDSYATCRQHYAQHGHQKNTVYLHLDDVPEAEVGNWHRALLFSVASASRATVLDNHLPQRIPGTRAYVLDLAELKWSPKAWDEVVRRYPYGKGLNRYVRGTWLIHQLADTRDSNALYLLLYGQAAPFKTDADFLKYWGVNEKAQQAGITIGWTETQSQVNKQGTRFVERFITAGDDPLKGLSFGRSLWRTKDSFFVQDGTDPLETLNGEFLHQGRELIVQFPKLGKRNGKLTYGAAQAYLLAAGNADAQNKPVANEGAIVQEAPVRLVEDFNKTLGQTAIINHSGCITCHDAGMKFPTENGLEGLLRVGVELRVYDRHKKEQIEAFNLTDVGIQLQRDCEDYAEFVEACNGLTPSENSRNYKRVLDLWIADLALEDAARELYCTPEDLRDALAYASANQIETGNRLAGLAHGRKIPRTQWESDYLKAQAMLGVWQGGNATPLAMADAIQRARRGGPVPAAVATDTPQDTAARLVVHLPADAWLWIDSKHMANQTGPKRTFRMEVKAGWKGTMLVQAVREVDGVKWVDTKTVQCESGKVTEVAMDFRNARAES